jgi:hypothetical protein
LKERSSEENYYVFFYYMKQATKELQERKEKLATFCTATDGYAGAGEGYRSDLH